MTEAERARQELEPFLVEAMDCRKKLAGLESDLRGVKGSAQVVVNSGQHMVSEIASQAPITGNNVTLTIDAGAVRALRSGKPAKSVRVIRPELDGGSELF